KIRISFVDHHRCVRGGTQDFLNMHEGDKCTGGVVWIGDEEDARLSAQGRENSFEWKLHLRAVMKDVDASAKNFSVKAIHRECRLENKNATARVNESVEENAQSIVAAIGEQEFGRPHAEMAGDSCGGALVFWVHGDLFGAEFRQSNSNGAR